MGKKYLKGSKDSVKPSTMFLQTYIDYDSFLNTIVNYEYSYE